VPVAAALGGKQGTFPRTIGNSETSSQKEQYWRGKDLHRNLTGDSKKSLSTIRGSRLVREAVYFNSSISEGSFSLDAGQPRRRTGELGSRNSNNGGPTGEEVNIQIKPDAGSSNRAPFPVTGNLSAGKGGEQVKVEGEKVFYYMEERPRIVEKKETPDVTENRFLFTHGEEKVLGAF